MNNDFIKQIKFEFDKKLKTKYYSTNYFLKTIQILKKQNKYEFVTMQFIHFNKTPIMVCGTYEIISLLKFCLTKDQFNSLNIRYVPDGQIIEENHPILIIEGCYTNFGYLENIIDGILSRRCSVATNVYYCFKELKSHQNIIFMADRSDDYLLQKYDGYAAYLAGIRLFVTEGQVEFFRDQNNYNIVGTMPHALIQQYNGDLNKVIIDYKNVIKHNSYALVDYHNDVITELDKIKSHFNLIDGIRIDTSNCLIDESLKKANIREYGVNIKLVELTKQWLIKNNFINKKIIVSSGIDNNKIKYFNQSTDAIDYFGIGSHLISKSVHISADLVELNHQKEAKTGRKLLENQRFLIKYEEI